ncbi:MAG: GAF domain-containing protein, partial [Nitrospinota bacterium]
MVVKAGTRVPQEKGISPAHEAASLKEKIARLSTLIDINAIITSTLDLEEVLKLVMEKAKAVMRAEATSVMLMNEETGRLEFAVTLGGAGEKALKRFKLRPGQGIAGWVAERGEPALVADVHSDPRFFKDVDRATGFRTRSILAAPLKVKDRVVGVAEVLNPMEGTSFTEEDLELFTAYCRQVAVAVENARLHESILEKERLDEQLRLASVIQRSFLPQDLPRCPRKRFSIQAYSRPASQVGGDFYDCF